MWQFVFQIAFEMSSRLHYIRRFTTRVAVTQHEFSVTNSVAALNGDLPQENAGPKPIAPARVSGPARAP